MATKHPTGARNAEQLDEWPEADARQEASSPASDEGLVGDAMGGLGWETESGGKAGGIADTLRKAMVAGLGAVFMTEEGIRTLVKDLKLPKELLGFVLGQAERSKTELLRMVQNELRRFLESELLRKELRRMLSDMVVEVKAEVRLRPDGREPEVKDRLDDDPARQEGMSAEPLAPAPAAASSGRRRLLRLLPLLAVAAIAAWFFRGSPHEVRFRYDLGAQREGLTALTVSYVALPGRAVVRTVEFRYGPGTPVPEVQEHSPSLRPGAYELDVALVRAQGTARRQIPLTLGDEETLDVRL